MSSKFWTDFSTTGGGGGGQLCAGSRIQIFIMLRDITLTWFDTVKLRPVIYSVIHIIIVVIYFILY